MGFSLCTKGVPMNHRVNYLVWHARLENIFIGTLKIRWFVQNKEILKGLRCPSMKQAASTLTTIVRLWIAPTLPSLIWFNFKLGPVIVTSVLVFPWTEAPSSLRTDFTFNLSTSSKTKVDSVELIPRQWWF